MCLNFKVLFLVTLILFASAITIISASFQMPEFGTHWQHGNLGHTAPSDILSVEEVDCPGGG